jgi:hypothetical protein
VARRPHPISAADNRPRIYLKQRLVDGHTVGWWGSKPPEHCVGRFEITVPLALSAALASVEHVEAVIIWLGKESAI